MAPTLLHWPLVVAAVVFGAAVSAIDGPNAPGTEGDLTLVGGTAPGTGSVLVYHDNRWGKICDDGWNLQAAHVVCKALGYARALMAATSSHFGGDLSEYDFWLDDIRCYGHEKKLTECEHEPWGQNNCGNDENAGVFCVPHAMEGLGMEPIPAEPERPKETIEPTTLLPPTQKPIKKLKKKKNTKPKAANRNLVNTIQDGFARHFPTDYPVRLANGRTPNEGLVEVNIDGQWGVICGDDWGLMEGMVACKQAGFGYAQQAMDTTLFGGTDKVKVLSGIKCEGDEETLSKCHHEHLEREVSCSNKEKIASVICTDVLPDLVPNATLVQESSYLQDQPMYYLQCAMEENCAAATAYTIRETYRDWHLHRRRLLRFSSSTWNFGTADFRPKASKESWEWHLCHMHYHSMHVFAAYDLVDENHNRVAQGHKASFCLEDVQCLAGTPKKYACKGFGDQGISVGCADDYLHDIDCQWIDITDVPPGKYIFKVHINPDRLVAELDYSNNAVMCDVDYTGYDITLTDCKLGPG